MFTFEPHKQKQTTEQMFLLKIVPFLCGWMADRLLGDPEGWPHPIVWFGKAIAYGEKKLNNGTNRLNKGVLLTLVLVGGVYYGCSWLLNYCNDTNKYLALTGIAIGVFYCLAGKTLIQEVKAVFEAVDRSTDEGRRQVARIVGRDTSFLTPQQIRAATLETLAENLSDGVIAPMFWFVLLGLPGMMAYKMINTLDSMIGYKNERYNEFGRFAAQTDDVANYIPARLTAVLMLLFSGNWSKAKEVKQNGKLHASPNSGYPEAALAVILNCRFGGPNYYFGSLVNKPYIGSTQRELNTADMQRAIQVNSQVEIGMGLLVCILLFIQ